MERTADEHVPHDEVIAWEQQQGTALTVQQLLEFHAEHPRHHADRESLIRQVFGISPMRFEQLLNAAIDTREALEYDPQAVYRLRAEREGRRELRAQREGRAS